MLLTEQTLCDGTVVYLDENSKERYLLFRDDNAVMSNEHCNYDEVAMYTYHSVGMQDLEKPDNEIVDIFIKLYEKIGDYEKAYGIVDRWLDIFHPEKEMWCDWGTIHDYPGSGSQKIFVVTHKNFGHPATYIKEYQQLINGWVWEVLDTEADDFCNRSCSNIYANTPKEALTKFSEIWAITNEIEFTTA